MKKIPYGITDYKELVTEDYYYVDKTMYLEKLENMSNKKLVYLRPRRFGKTLFTSMLYYYYDINSSDKFDTLFKDTYVYNNLTDLKNSYYVIRFDFSSMNFTHDVKDIESEFIIRLIDGIHDFNVHYNLNAPIDKNISKANVVFINFIMYLKSLNLDKKLYIIIDEYDNFTNSILEGNTDLFRELLGNDGFVKSFYSAIKAHTLNSIIDRVFITGVCSISLDAMTSGFNIATNISNDYEFNAMTALTHGEVKSLIKEIDVEKQEDIFNTMLDNYNGYKFNKRVEKTVFNPTLVMYYLGNYYRNGFEPDELFDKNIISSFTQIKSIITIKNNSYYKDILNSIFENGYVHGKIVSNFELNTGISYDIVVSLLYYFGYITISREYDPSINKLEFVIPNKAISLIFTDYLIEILKEDSIIFNDEKIFEAEIEMREEGKIEKLTNYVSEVLKSAGNRVLEKFNEKYIQLLYYAMLSPRNTYKTYMEYQSNNLYIDLLLLKNNVNAKYDILIEFKYIKKGEYSDSKLEEVRNKALEQINSYILDDRIDKDNLRKYIVIFKGNEVGLIEEIL